MTVALLYANSFIAFNAAMAGVNVNLSRNLSIPPIMEFD